MTDVTGQPRPEEPSADALVGRAIAERYRVDALIARGGMARVYRGRDQRLERDVAIKVLSAPYADDPAFTARFLHEARAAASLSHPSLVHVYDSGSDEGAHYIVMELLDRHRSLRDEIDEYGPLAGATVLRIGRELLAGLRVVHERGLVHCDVKSGNVMLGPGVAKLIDFGIARSPRDERDGDTSIGSLQFMAPEQLHGEALTSSSDLFSLGVVLYEALTGALPYPGATPEEVSSAQDAGAPRPPASLARGVPDALNDAVLQALRRDPGSRFHSAEAMAHALGASDEASGDRDEEETDVVRVLPPAPEPPPARSAGYVPPPAPPPPPRAVAPRPPSRPARRSRGLWSWIGTLAVLATAALVVLLVVVPLLNLGREAADPGASPSVQPEASAPPGTVLIPETIGLATSDAIAAADEAGLDWTVRCAEDPAQPEGIIDQEPAAGTQVAPGSTFTMYSARFADCR